MNRRSSLRSSSEPAGPGSRLRRAPRSAWKRVGGLLEAVAPDEPHGVVGPAVGVGAQAVDRDDPRVLEPAGDLGLEQEAGAADRVVGVLVEDLLERHLAVQLLVEGDEDGAQSAAGVGPEDAEPLAVGGRRADGKAGGPVGVALGTRADVGEGLLDLGVADRGEHRAGGGAGGDGGEAPLGAAVVRLEVDRAMASTAGRCVWRRGGPGRRGGRPASGPCRCVQARNAVDELVLVDQAVLQGEQSEEQVAIGGGHGVLRGRSVTCQGLPSAGVARF